MVSDWFEPALIPPIVLTLFYFATLFLSLSHALQDLPWSGRREQLDGGGGQQRRRGAADDEDDRTGLNEILPPNNNTADGTAMRVTGSSSDTRKGGTKRAVAARGPTLGFSAKARTAARNIFAVTLAFASVAMAWYHITVFMLEDRAAYPDAVTWVRDSSWFVKAYALVTATPQQWLWSSQLLQGVGTIVVFCFVESFRSGGARPLSSFWLGCAAAISFAFPLFVAAVWNTPGATYNRRLLVPFQPLLLAAVVASAVAVVLLPSVTTDAYGPVLATVHVALLAPLAVAQLFGASIGPAERSVAPTSSADVARRRLVVHSLKVLWLPATYGALAGLGLMAHIHNIVKTLEAAGGLGPFVDLIGGAFCANACQCSISGDVLVTSFFAAVMIAIDHRTLSAGARFTLVAFTPIASFSTTLPCYLAAREIALIQRRMVLAERIAIQGSADSNSNPPSNRSTPPPQPPGEKTD